MIKGGRGPGHTDRSIFRESAHSDKMGHSSDRVEAELAVHRRSRAVVRAGEMNCARPGMVRRRERPADPRKACPKKT